MSMTNEMVRYFVHKALGINRRRDVDVEVTDESVKLWKDGCWAELPRLEHDFLYDSHDGDGERRYILQHIGRVLRALDEQIRRRAAPVGNNPEIVGPLPGDRLRTRSVRSRSSPP